MQRHGVTLDGVRRKSGMLLGVRFCVSWTVKGSSACLVLRYSSMLRFVMHPPSLRSQAVQYTVRVATAAERLYRIWRGLVGCAVDHLQEA